MDTNTEAQELRNEDDMQRHNTKYKPDELPASITRRLYVSYGMGEYNAGQIQVRDFDYRGRDGFETVPLCFTEVTIAIPQKVDIKKQAVEVLEQQKRDIHAEYHQKLKGVQDKIDALLAIEYKPAAGEANGEEAA